MIKLFSALILSIFIPLTAAAADYSDATLLQP